MTPFRSPRGGNRLRALWLAAGIALVGCSPAPPAQSPSPSAAATASAAPAASPTPMSSEALAAMYATISAQVQEIRGLNEKEPVVPVVVSPAELADVLSKQLGPPEVMTNYELLYKAMGLLPTDAHLNDVYGELLESQVAGMYDPSKKTLYVLSKSGGVGPFERSIYAHEYEHALQDQHFGFAAHTALIKDNSDRGLAWQSVFEGDAYTLQAFWMLKELTPFELMDMLGKSQDPEQLAALEKIPPIVIAKILFAAIQGTSWISQVYAEGGWPAVDGVFVNPPVSTEQILHPDKWATRESPIEVDLPDDLPGRLGAGWTEALEDTFGEQQFAVWLTGHVDIEQNLKPPPPPEAAAGWGGDRLQLLRGPGEQWAVVLKTEWDTAADAVEFEGAIAPMLSKAGGPGGVLVGVGGTVRWIVIGSDEATLKSVAAALGLAG